MQGSPLFKKTTYEPTVPWVQEDSSEAAFRGWGAGSRSIAFAPQPPSGWPLSVRFVSVHSELIAKNAELSETSPEPCGEGDGPAGRQLR